MQVYWFGPLIGGIGGGALYDIIYSTKSSFSRIRTCLFVFHPRDGRDATKTSPTTDDEARDDQQPEQTGEPELAEVEYTNEPKRETGDNKQPRSTTV